LVIESLVTSRYPFTFTHPLEFQSDCAVLNVAGGAGEKWNWHLHYKTVRREHVLFAYNLCVQLIASVKTGRIRLPPPYSEARDEEIEKKVSSSIIGYTRYSANEARLSAVRS
jgi:hypothetical protein